MSSYAGSVTAPLAVTSLATLTPVQVRDVLALADDAQRVDGVRPINEATELRLRAPADAVHLLSVQDGDLRGYAQVSGVATATPEVELVVVPGHRRHGVGRELLREAVALSDEQPLQGWAHGDLPAARAFAASEGFEAVRGLWRMRRAADVPLPELTVPDGVRIRAFEPGRDEDEWLAVNARAFAFHPEQGRWTREELAARMVERWFDPAGFLLAHDATTGELLGFHWTKEENGHGEVYVVGVDPSAQGRRLGVLLTLAGLHHLHGRGVKRVDLYVESDNEPALAVYRRLGFRQDAVDVMYRQAR